MGLRYRLFLWVSGLFIALAATSYFLENKVTAYQLSQARQAMRSEILSLSETRRQNLQKFIAESIAENMVKIDAILNNILQYSPIALRFSPLSANEEKGTWGEAADLLLEYKWIDFLQNTAESHVVALISPQEESIDETYQIPINDALFWVYYNREPKAYLGVKIPYFLTLALDGGKEKLAQVPGEIPLLFFAFDLEKLERISSGLNQNNIEASIPVKWTEGYSLDVQTFVKTFTEAHRQIFEHQLIPPNLSQEELIQAIDSAKKLKPPLLSPAFVSSIPQEKLMKSRLENVALEYTQVNLLWIWMALFDSGVFGENLFQFPAPFSIGMTTQTDQLGFGIKSDKALFSAPIFNDEAYYSAHPFSLKGPGLANGFAVIPSEGRLFLGNTAQFIVNTASQERKGYLTLGIDANSLLERLVLALNQTVILIHEGKVFGAYQEDGERLPEQVDFPFSQMQDYRSGSVSWKGEKYFYMHMQPFKEVDFHLILLNPEVKEFALLNDLESGSQRVVHAILFNIHVTGLIALLIAIVMLHKISRRITEPIVELAEATEHVAKGSWDQIQLQTAPFKHQDEVAQLYQAFSKMICGLQEKEKYRAVLNKMVSTEIAQEILEGNVHLGGEEKRVSVLFADIRQFTAMTQRLPAREVIDLLNVCMTRLSAVVDQNQGVIDKYVGDEVMALFGAPLSRGNDSLHAVKTAIEMIHVMNQWNCERKLAGQIPVEIGIGIHTGVMLAGNMGAENRLNYTVIGRNVNLAARLCSAAKPMEILISESTWEEVKEQVSAEALPHMTLKGFDDLVPVYRILG